MDIKDIKKDFIWKGTGERRVPNAYDSYSALLNSCVLHRLQHVLPFVKRNQEILDLGCGVGWNAKFISLFCTKVYGLDIHEEAIEYATKHNGAANIEWIVGSMTDFSMFPDSSIDLVIAIESIEHLAPDEMRIALGEVARVLKPGRILVGTTSIFREKSRIKSTKWHKYEPSLAAFKELIGGKFDIVKIENVQVKTWDLRFSSSAGQFILRTKNIK